LNEEGHKKRIRRLKPEFGDIIYGREGTFGEAAIIPKNVDLSLGQRVVLFRPDKEKVSSIYLWALIRSNGLYQQALRKTSGSTVGHINIKGIKTYKCMIPPIELQNEFEKIIENIEVQKAELKQSLQDSEDLFKGLLQKIFN
jgi:type I restriction enzyme S subunit